MRRIAFWLASTALALVVAVGAFRAYAHWLVRRRDTLPMRNAPKARFDPEKPTIFLFHGLSGSAFQLDMILRPAFERFANVETFELPGHGNADPILSAQRTIAGLSAWAAEAVVERLDALGIEQATILGISLGGEVVLRLATDRPDLFNAVVLFEPPYRGKYASRWQRKGFAGIYRWYRFIKPSLDTLSRKVLIETVWNISNMWGGIEEDDGSRYESSAIAEMNVYTSSWNDRQKDSESLLDYVQEVLSYDGKAHIDRYDAHMPTLLIKGGETTDAIVATTDSLYDHLLPRLACLRRVVMPGLAHKAPYRYPTHFSDIVRKFFEDEELPPHARNNGQNPS